MPEVGGIVPASSDTAWAMSQESVEIVRSVFRPGEPNRFFDLLDEEVEHDASAVPHMPEYPAGVVHGKNAFVRVWRRYWGTWDDYVLEPIEFIDAGEDRVVVVTDERGRGRGSGVPFEQRSATIFTLRAGKIARLQIFNTREEALEAAGLSK